MRVTYFILAIIVSASTTTVFAGQPEKQKQTAWGFIENRGQYRTPEGSPLPQVMFVTERPGTRIILTKTGFSYEWSQVKSELSAQKPEEENIIKELKISTINTHRVDVKLVGAHFSGSIEGVDRNMDYINYYNIPQVPEGILEVPNFQKVVYKNVYPNIDWVFYSKPDGSLKYDFIVHPGGNPADIVLQYEGATSLKLLENGNVKIITSLGETEEDAPLSFQGKIQIPSRYELKNNRVSFKVEKYNLNEALVIDPMIRLWGTYIKTGAGYNYPFFSGQNRFLAASFLTTDSANSLYIAANIDKNGTTNISYNGYQNTYGGGDMDAMVEKFDSAGNRIWATYYGYSDADYVYGLNSDNKSIVMVGLVPKVSVFMVKFNLKGQLIWSNYQYGEMRKTLRITDLDIDRNKKIYLTYSYPSQNGVNFFTAKYNESGVLLTPTFLYFGSEHHYVGGKIAINYNNDIYVTFSESNLVKWTASVHQKNHGGGIDAVLIKYDSTGKQLWSTFYGGGGNEFASDVHVDDENNIILMGLTNSDNNIASNGHRNDYKYNNKHTKYNEIFVVKFDADGKRLWGTYYDADGKSIDNNLEHFMCLTTDKLNNIYFASSTFLKDKSIPLFGHQNTNNSFTLLTDPSICYEVDAFLVKLTPSGERISATFYGGLKFEYVCGLAVDKSNNVYLAGATLSEQGIAANGYLNTFPKDGASLFLVKFKEGCRTSFGSTKAASSSDTLCHGMKAAFKLTNEPKNPHSIRWYPGLGLSDSLSSNTTLTYNSNINKYYIKILIDSTIGCFWADTINLIAAEPMISISSALPVPGSPAEITWNGFIKTNKLTVKFTNDGGDNWMNILENQLHQGNESIVLPKSLAAGNWLVKAEDLSTGCVATDAELITFTYVSPNRIDYYEQVKPDTARNFYNVIEPGLPLRFKLRVENDYGFNLLTLKGIIRTKSPWVKITDSLASFNNILLGKQEWGVDEYEILIDPATPQGSVAIMELWMKDEIVNDGPWGSTFTIPLTPYFKTSRQLIDDDSNPDSKGNNNDIAEPNETIEIIPLLENLSDKTIYNTYAQLISPYSNVTVWNNKQGANTVVKHLYKYNSAGSNWAPVNPKATDIIPEEDYVFDYNFKQPYGISLFLLVSGYPDVKMGNSWDKDGVLHRWRAPFFMNSGYPNIGLNTAETGSQFKIYPNPADDRLYITAINNSVTKNTTITLLDARGKEIFKNIPCSDFGDTIISLKDITSGIYILQIKSDLGSSTRKISVQH